MLLTLLAGAGTALAMDKSVTVQVDGQAQSVSTMSTTVDGALRAAGLQVGEHDTLAPSASTAIAAGDTIVLRRGRLLELTIDGQERSVWTTALTVDEALAELGLTGPDMQLSASRSARLPLEGIALDVSNPHNVTFVDAGVAHAVRTTAATVGALLAERGMALQQADTVTADLAAPVTEGMQLTINRVRTADIVATQPVPAPVQTVDDPTQPVGKTTVQTKAVDGVQTVTFRVTTTNGAETARQQVSVTVTTPAVPGVTLVGSKPPTAAAPAPSAPAPSAPAPSSPATSAAAPAAAGPGAAAPAAASGNTGASAP
ncbi:MAG: ubiquitin-like domain-containing protein, partial [Mycobacteriaceae bacterium]